MENLTAAEESSLYDDLVHQGDLGSLIHKLQTKNNQLELHVVSLEEDIQKLCNRITEMKHTQDNLSRNISELYKTAKSEIDRKDRIIAELQSKLDDVVFRRNTIQNFPNKRFREEPHFEPEIKKPRFENKPGNQNQDHDNATIKSTHGNQKISHDTRHRNSVRNERDSREHTARSDNDRRRRSNSRDRNFRRDYRDNRGRNNSNDRNRNARNRGSRGGRDHNSRSRNEHHDRSSRPDEREQSDVKDQRVSPIDLTEVLPEPTQEIDILDLSKEDGEISDVEAESKTQELSEKNPARKRGQENKIPCSEVKAFNVSEFIVKQKEMSVKRTIDRKVKDINEKKTEIKDIKEADKMKNNDIKLKDLSVTIEKNPRVDKKIADIHQSKDNHKAKDSGNKFEEKDPVQNSKSEKKPPEKENLKGKTEDQTILKTDKIKILSQVKLNVEKVEPIVQRPIPEAEPQKNEPKFQPVSKIDRSVKESRVPRNLIEDLDIKLDKSTKVINKTKETNKDKKTKQSEKIQEKLTSLFDTPIKKEIKPKAQEIPTTSKTDIDMESNQSVVDMKETSTPVTEFQIFKTNLPCLENSLTNIQFQTKTDKSSKTDKEILLKVPNEALDNTTKFVENESAGYGNTSDICNISLDLLNAEICKFKPEDFPNLTAHSEVKDISDILLSPANKGGAVKVTNEQKVQVLTPPAQIQKNEAEQKEPSSNDKPTPDGNLKKKRRRCVMKWIE